MRYPSSSDGRRGSALLAVLWLSIAMSVIAFALSRSVRAEFERAGLNVDSTRAYFLAQGAIERATLHMAGQRPPSAETAPVYAPGQTLLRFAFPAGVAEVEIVGENGKVDLNQASPEVLARLLAACGLDPSQAVAVAATIVGFRSGPANASHPLQSRNLSSRSSFSGRRASFQELEDLLMVPGITPEVLYGTYRRNERGELVWVGGLYRHLTLLGSGSVSAQYASPEVLAAAGLARPRINSIVALRSLRPLTSDDVELPRAVTTGEGLRLGLGGQSRAFTLRATARLRDGRAIRTVGALIQLAPAADGRPVRFVRWYDMDF